MTCSDNQMPFCFFEGGRVRAVCVDMTSENAFERSLEALAFLTANLRMPFLVEFRLKSGLRGRPRTAFRYDSRTASAEEWTKSFDRWYGRNFAGKQESLLADGRTLNEMVRFTFMVTAASEGGQNVGRTTSND